MQAQRQMFWSKFEGPEGSGMPVIRKDDLSKDAGDVIHIQTVKNLTGAGVTGESTLQGNEERLSLTQTDLSIDWFRHAVAISKRSKKRINFDFVVQAAQPLLSYHIAKTMDDAIFTEFGTATTALYAGDATSTATLDASDTLSTTTLDKIKTYLDSNLAMPLRLENGNQYYGIIIHPYDAYNLRQDSTWSQAQRDANLRGETNPIFSGALGVYNGMIVYANTGVSNSSNKSKCVAFGGETIFRGYGMMPGFVTQLYDYGFEIGVGMEAIYGEQLNDAVNTNFAVVETYATNPNA
jgi:N4-gp56 family major capsid protein